MKIDYALGYEIMLPQSLELELKHLSQHSNFKLNTSN